MAARRLDKLDEVCRLVEKEYGTAIKLKCDVTDPAALHEAVDKAVQAFGGIDVAVANAGFGVNGAFQKLNTDDFRRQFETNVFGVINTIYAVLPYLVQSKGRLGLVSSVMGRVGMPASAAYCASKFAVCGLSESLYYELAAKGVSVTCIEPGLVESDIRRTDNIGNLHADRPDPAPQWLVMPSDKAARKMVHALYRRKPEAVITNHGKTLVFLNRHFPGTMRFILRRFAGDTDSVERAKRGHVE
ncbi:MAG: hypothetical protein AMXMBFR84_34880 [Candidatus Hydrogenedentota bacterium]